MMKRFKKLLSALCIIALLVSSMATVFANGDNDAETSAPQDTVIETKAEENAGTEDAVPETAPVQETASAPEANPVQAGASATEEADAASAAPAAEEASEKENTGDEDAAPAQGEDPAAQTASVPEDTSDLNAAPVQDDTSAANKYVQED
jgi:cytoskeletal protein RodZ